MAERKVTKLLNTVPNSINEANKTVVFRISDGKPDRDGEIIDQRSWDFTDYLSNPLLIVNHDASDVENAIGTAEDLWYEAKDDATYGRFKIAAEASDKAKTVWNLLKAGVLRTVSVGFITDPMATEYTEDGMPILKGNKLLETSVVLIPANPRAIMLSLKERSISRKDATWLMETMRNESQLLEKQLEQEEVEDDSVNQATEKQLTAMMSAIESLTKATSALTSRVDGLTEKTAIKSSLPLAPEDTPWDSGKAIKNVKAWASDEDGNIDFKKYRKAFFFVDDDSDGDDNGGMKQGDYHLPFADVIDGELKAVWDGVKAAYGAVEGARGGFDFGDDSDQKDAVLAQIKKYYKKFGKEMNDEKSFTAETKTKGVVADIASIEDKWDLTDDKFDQLAPVANLFYALQEAWFYSGTPMDAFEGLLTEFVALVGKVLDGSYEEKSLPSNEALAKAFDAVKTKGIKELAQASLRVKDTASVAGPETPAAGQDVSTEAAVTETTEVQTASSEPAVATTQPTDAATEEAGASATTADEPTKTPESTDTPNDKTTEETATATEADESESAKGGSNDQSGADTDELDIDPEAELTPELQAQIDSAMNADNKE